MFYDTKLSNHVLHAFQALALDETRGPFSPALWERTEDNTTTDLRQVWFPGNHANIGGGWPDQGVANITMACTYLSPFPLNAMHVNERRKHQLSVMLQGTGPKIPSSLFRSVGRAGASLRARQSY